MAVVAYFVFLLLRFEAPGLHPPGLAGSLAHSGRATCTAQRHFHKSELVVARNRGCLPDPGGDRSFLFLAFDDSIAALRCIDCLASVCCGIVCCCLDSVP